LQTYKDGEFSQQLFVNVATGRQWTIESTFAR